MQSAWGVVVVKLVVVVTVAKQVMVMVAMVMVMVVLVVSKQVRSQGEFQNHIKVRHNID